nr:hypothetical protein BaRGS_002583 [Batillaria attramentaria]
MGKFTYPEARRDESVVEDYHGTKVNDPYRWLEDPDAEETKAFVDAQNEVSKPFIEACPVREKLLKRITEVWDYAKYGCPFKRGDNYYYFHNTGLQNQSVMYIQDSLDAEPRVFFDPNKLTTDGTISLRGHAFSENGAYWAYGLSESGSDWITMKFKKAPSSEDMPDTLKKVKFSSMAWTHDHKGIFYNRYPDQEGKSDGTETTSNLHQKLYYHRLGTDQDQDILYITNNGTVFTFKTNKDAPRYKVINIDLAKPEPENWQTLIDEDKSAVLEWVGCVNDTKLVVCYLHDVKSELFIYDLATGTRETQLPLDVGSIVGYSGRRKDKELFREITVKGFDASQFQIEQQFYKSKDGTKIPMFIVHKKDLKLDGSHPVILYGYGGFSISITPSFSPSRTVFLQHLGGVYAVANIRGGNEYGETWHKNGTLGNKQNGFDDFQAAAEHLIANKYTSPGKIAINGGSNGGLLVGASLNQRPDLFAAGVAQVGVVPLHSLKFIAELQHSLGKKEGQIEEITDLYSFLYQTIGLAWTD